MMATEAARHPHSYESTHISSSPVVVPSAAPGRLADTTASRAISSGIMSTLPATSSYGVRTSARGVAPGMGPDASFASSRSATSTTSGTQSTNQSYHTNHDQTHSVNSATASSLSGVSADMDGGDAVSSKALPIARASNEPSFEHNHRVSPLPQSYTSQPQNQAQYRHQSTLSQSPRSQSSFPQQAPSQYQHQIPHRNSQAQNQAHSQAPSSNQMNPRQYPYTSQHQASMQRPGSIPSQPQSLANVSAPAVTNSISSDIPQPTQNIMNRRAGSDSSLYQICINLKRRLADVPGFHEHIAEMDEEEALEGDFIDPVTSMWNCLRQGFPLMTVYNALRPVKRLEVDAKRYGEAKIGKAATFQFLQACLNELKIPSNETFLITDLYGEDTTGFVKVTKCVNKVLDVLQQRGLLIQRRNTTSEQDPSLAPQQTMTHRQKIVDEFVKTERDYVQHLETLQQFKDELDAKGAIAGDAAHDIFLNLNALLDFQRRFLIRIEQQNSLSEAQQDWGKLLHYYRDSFRVYEPFIANQNRCRETVERQWDKLSQAPVKAELRDLVDTPATLLGFLLKPFQRLTKYPLLLRELRNKGGLDEQRRKNLDDGISAAESILYRANEAIHKEQRITAVSDLQQRVEDWKGHRIDHFGDLLLHGTYTVLKGEGSKEVEREYKVYLFERILLCCKEIDLNKPKNKILGAKNPHLDRKGQPKLQLKGRIFMQNVTEVMTFKKPSFYTLQIYWKGDPGVENFVIRFSDEKTMTQWEQLVLQQKEILIDALRRASQQGTSSTEFVSLQTQPRPENPYQELDDEEDEEDHDIQAANAAMHATRLAPNDGRSGSTASFRSTASISAPRPSQSSGSSALSSMQQQYRYAGPDSANLAAPAPPLSLVTDMSPGLSSPGEHIGQSYFSPANDSPISTRSSSQTSTFGFSRQPLRPAGWNYDQSKHRTAPAMSRAPSRDGSATTPSTTTIQAARPSLPAMTSSQQAQSQFAQAQNRWRSASTPDINGPGQRRTNPSPSIQEGVAVPPMPQMMRGGINRSQTSSPFDPAQPPRGSFSGQPKYDGMLRHAETDPVHSFHHGTNLSASSQNQNQFQTSSSSHQNLSSHQQYQFPIHSLPYSLDAASSNTRDSDNSRLFGPHANQITSNPIHPYDDNSCPPDVIPQAVGRSGPNSTGTDASLASLLPVQLKVKIHFDPVPSHVTIVVPTSIKYKSLIDRIDSKMVRVSPASIASNTARLCYKDRDNDFIVIKLDEDIADSIEEWAAAHEVNLRNGIVDDFELYWQEKEKRVT